MQAEKHEQPGTEDDKICMYEGVWWRGEQEGMYQDSMYCIYNTECLAANR